MNSSPNKAGSRLPGLLIGGMVAGALGLALAIDGDPSASPRVPSDPVTGKSDSYTPGLANPAADTGMSSATGSYGTGHHASSGKYGSGTEASTSLPPNVTPGWKIRVCSEKTKADQINFKFTPAGSKSAKGNATGATGSSTGMGGSGTAGDADQTASWSRGEASEIKVPSGVRDADKIRIEATPSQKDKKASVCVIYDDHVAKKMNFDDREVSTVKSSDNGECGC
jgi:hypothetical protein